MLNKMKDNTGEDVSNPRVDPNFRILRPSNFSLVGVSYSDRVEAGYLVSFIEATLVPFIKDGANSGAHEFSVVASMEVTEGFMESLIKVYSEVKLRKVPQRDAGDDKSGEGA